MNHIKIEIGVNICQCKQSGRFYQNTNKYTLCTNIGESIRERVSWVPIDEITAAFVIKTLNLKKQESNAFLTYASA